MWQMTELEKAGRERLRLLKPRVYEKIITHEDKIMRRECVAIVGLQYRYDCNLRCQHCGIERLKDASRKMMDVDDVKNLADQMDEMGLASVCITGGEPIIFKDLEDIFKAVGPDRFNIAMDSNGMMLTEEKIKWIIDLGVDRIQLSIDGQQQTHAQMRGKEVSYSRCLRTLEAAIRNKLKVVVNVVATKSLIRSGELIQHLDFLSQFGQHINVLSAKCAGAFLNRKDEIPNQEENDFIESLTKKYNMSTHQTPNIGYPFGCYAVKRMFNITPYGDLIPCCFVPISLGNVLEEPLKDIVDRGLSIKWFGYDCAKSCLAGNTDDEFFKRILPQIFGKKQPVHYTEIDWEA